MSDLAAIVNEVLSIRPNPSVLLPCLRCKSKLRPQPETFRLSNGIHFELDALVLLNAADNLE